MALLQSPSSSSSSSSFSYGFTYHVFLSFRGSDTRLGFTGHLYEALRGKGIHTFIDDKELQRGDEIRPSLDNAIEESRIFIPVFSIDYASSSFCLDELARIIHCSNEKGRLILPVFYGVDPSHVRHQTGSYGDAIAKHKKKFQNNTEKYTHPFHIILLLLLLAFLLHSHVSAITLFLLLLSLFFLLIFLHLNNKEDYADNMERLHNWKRALNQAANLSGYHFNLGNEREHDFIVRIVKEVSDKINRTPLHVADYPVGLESRVLQVKSLLDVGSNDGVHMVGIHGMGGIGKTTLARAIYNLIADQFEALCFLHNVREDSAQYGFENLQEKLLSKTIGLDIKLGDVNEGIPIIKERLHRKKVLLILEDVDELKQLQVLAGGLDWFGLGSRVIITTREKHLLASHGIERTYEVDELKGEEALELLRWNAFKNNTVDSSYKDILNDAVTYASGLPLALEVVGSSLFGKNVGQWKSTLDWHGRILDRKIQNILEVSFYALEEYEQSVFLDIACCFKGYQLSKLEDILHAHYGYCMKHQIEVLVEKSLIKISKWAHTYYVTLHDLIEGMGKTIVQQESLKDPGKRSRLWLHKNIIDVLEENKGTSKIEIIYLHFPSREEEMVEWNGDEFKKMENLKTLIIKNGRFSKGPEHLPNSLRVLEWPRYPSRDIPSDFCPKRLSICKLQESCLTSFKLCSSLKGFVNMRELNLASCHSLTQILDVSGLLNLEIFSFQNCKNLITIHNSVGFLNKLKILDAKGCCKLESFPPIQLTSLQELRLSNCKSLKSFPEILGEMESITQIELLGTSIGKFPFSFQNLTGLRNLTVHGSGMLRLSSSILTMPKLSEIYASGFCLLLPKQNDKPSSLKKCKLLDEFLPTVLTRFANVKELDLSGNNFTIIPERIIECLFLGIFVSTFPCRGMLLYQELHEAGDIELCLPTGAERILERFEHQSKGSSISFWNGYEHKFIEKIFKYVSNNINRAPLHVVDYPVGIQSRVQQVKSLLDMGFDDGVHMMGIHGIGGIGKSTLARAIYNFVADQFECLCFLHNVRRNSAQNGLEHLQEELLSETTGLDTKLGDVCEGVRIIKQRLHRKKVLLILDDVDQLKQLQVLVGAPGWLGPGSRVIITTRDKHLLAIHGIERTCEVDELNREEALELLRWKAVKNNTIDSRYEDILKRMVTYAFGLPLVLEVMGSNLFGKKHIKEWESLLSQYERIPDKDIWGIWRILLVCFDALEKEEQSVFLDIACCFKGYALTEVEDILCAHYGKCMKYHIRVLVEKSLIKINWLGIVTLNDLVEDMGREIVRKDSPRLLEERSRLWYYRDIVEVLEENSGTDKIEIIYLDCPSTETVVDWNGKAFEKMKNLKTLIIKRCHFSRGPRQFPSSLRVLEWKGYPSQGMPSNFDPTKLAICKLPNSCFMSSELTSAWDKASEISSFPK